MGERWLTIEVEKEPLIRSRPAAVPTVRRPMWSAPPSRRRRVWSAMAGLVLAAGVVTGLVGAWMAEQSAGRWDAITGEATAAGSELAARSEEAAAALAAELGALEAAASQLGEASAAFDSAARVAADLEAAANGGLIPGPAGVELLVGEIVRLAAAIDGAFPGLSEAGVAGPEGPGSALRAAGEALITVTGVESGPGAGFGPFVLQYPLPGFGISDGFGTDRAGGFHNGIDIAAPVETPVLAAADGVVLQSGWLDDTAGYGVILGHEQGWETRYFHMPDADLPVGEGEEVTAGDVIGRVGSSGWSTGPHLHFEIVFGPIRFDPEQGFTYLGADGAAAAPNGGVGGAGARPEGGAPVVSEPGEVALWGAPGDLAGVRRDLVEIGTDAAGLAAEFEERRRAEQDRGRRAAQVVYAGLAVVVLGAVLWLVRPRWARNG